MNAANLFANLPVTASAELIDTLLQSRSMRVERIVSFGQASPPDFWYDQERPEWVVLLQGAARLQFQDAELELRPGDYVLIVAHCRHRVAWTSPDGPTIWLAIHYEA
jgi:cupin 2 domain-containing protein